MTAATTSPRWQRYVPRAFPDEDVKALRALLADYTETGICQRLNIPSLEGASMLCLEELAILPILTPLDALIRLFQACLYAGEAEVPAGMRELLYRLGMIASDTELPGLVYATVAILRVSGEWIVCDRGGAPDGSDYPLPPDFVYPPIFQNSSRYLSRLPRTPCEAMLELGTGAGLGAVVAAQNARRVWATDISSRAVHFASLSCRLAGLDSVTVLTGDLYHPVEGLTFDRIAFHPPWVPAAQSKFEFGNGGEDGEGIVRGAIEGLPRFLRPGGQFYGLLLASDREGERLEQRVRRWLGAAGDGFDIALEELSCESPGSFLAQNLANGSISEQDIPRWTEQWKATRTEAVVYGYLTVTRHDGEREPVTLRTPSRSDSYTP